MPRAVEPLRKTLAALEIGGSHPPRDGDDRPAGRESVEDAHASSKMLTPEGDHIRSEVSSSQRGGSRRPFGPPEGPAPSDALNQTVNRSRLDCAQGQAIFGGPQGRSSPAPGGTRGTGAKTPIPAA